jgi:predicted HAD superfamily hydrolase
MLSKHNRYSCINQPVTACQSGVIDRQHIERLFSLVDFVSLDFFDTLVERRGLFSPKDLFYSVQNEAEKQIGLFISDFTGFRIRAENTARTRAWGSFNEETTLDEIYTELGRMTGLDSDVVQRLKKIELDCERAVLTALESGRRLYEAALAAGKTVVINSDTYFDEEFIREIMGRTGYDNAHKVYTSSAFRRTKAEGSLYDLLIKDLKCAPDKILHIGDNRLSDVAVPLGKGIRSLHVTTPKHRLKWHSGLNDMQSGCQVMSGMLCEVSGKLSEKTNTEGLQSVLEKTATEQLSLLYYAFAAWLVQQLREGGHQRVYFAARDGLIMKRFFDLAASAAGLEIDSRYLYVSRAALYPSLIFTEPETARRLFCQSWDHLTIENALKRLSLTIGETRDALAKYGLSDTSQPLDKSTTPMFSAFLTEIWPLLEQKFKESYNLSVAYLHQEMVLSEEKTAYVDVGWHGSVQNCILKLLRHLGISHNLGGFYLGTFKKPHGAAPDFRASGYLLNNDEPPTIASLVRSGPSVIELFFSAGHGTVLGYKRDGMRVLPVLQDNPAEQEQFHEIIAPVQNHAFDFVSSQLKRLSGVKMMTPEAGVAARTALRFIYAPSIAEAKAFGRLRIASDFGASMKSITGALEFDLKKIRGDTLPDGKYPMWRPGFHALKNL